MRWVSAAISLALAGTGVFVACSIYDTSLLVGGEAGTPDGAIDAGPDVDLCKAAGWPQRPDQDDPGGPDVEFYNALTTLDFNASPDAGVTSIGFNLDGFCTCPEQESCKGGDAAPKHCDGKNGLDNSGASLIRQFSSSQGFFDQGYINGRLAAGVFGALFRIRGYNGKANDTKVELAVFVSNGTEGVQLGNPQVPKLDGTDKWTLDPTSLKGGAVADGGVPVPLYEDPNAYVRDGVLVGTLNFPLSVGAGTGEGLVTIELSGSIIAAKLEPSNGSFKVRGVVGGRWPTRKLLTTLQVLHDPLDGTKTQYLCDQNPTYQALKGRVCDFADISGNLLEDGKNAPCDSLSIGFGFEGAPATYGGSWPKPDAGFPCGPQWTDDCTQ
ncbi:hypothetical protein BH09MYX1_BH09MYX1_21950 [soil metagenome]